MAIRLPIGYHLRMSLTPKQQAFVREYLVDLNAAAAARRAGYSERSADRQGYENLRKPEIAAAIAEAQQARSDRVEAKADDVLRELLLVAYSDIGNVLDFSGDEVKLLPACLITPTARRTLASVKVKRHLEGSGDDAHEVEVIEFKLWDKMTALDKLARHLGLLKEAGTQVNLTIQSVAGVDEAKVLGRNGQHP